MKISFWFILLLLASPAVAQNLAGYWQGAEDPGTPRDYPSVLRLQRGNGQELFGVLYQETGFQQGVSVTFEMQGVRTATGMKLNHIRKLNETGYSPRSYWCDGSITFTYNADLEKLTGHATYEPVGDCDTGEFVFYRVKLKSAPTVKAGVSSTLRVSGSDVRWYADAACRKLVAAGNTYTTKLYKPTTFYIVQGYYLSEECQSTPVHIGITGKATPASPAAAAKAKPAAAPLPTLPTTKAPLVLPTVLFKQSTPELLPSAFEALDRLATALKEEPTVRLRIVGHTDRLAQDDPAKNQVLSEQRAAAVKAYLVKAGVAADRLETTGYGDTKRLYPSPDIRNRRVEVERL